MVVGGGRAFLRAPPSYVPSACGSVSVHRPNPLVPYFGAGGIDEMRFSPKSRSRAGPMAPNNSVAPAGVYLNRSYLTVGAAVGGGAAAHIRIYPTSTASRPHLTGGIPEPVAQFPAVSPIYTWVEREGSSRCDGPITMPTPPKGAVSIGGRPIQWRLTKSNSIPTGKSQYVLLAGGSIGSG